MIQKKVIILLKHYKTKYLGKEMKFGKKGVLLYNSVYMYIVYI